MTTTIMSTTVELASVPSADTPGSCIYVHHDKRSYVFGRVAEGTQRAFGSRKIHLGGTEHVFLSGTVGWDQMGGLLGYLLSCGGVIDSATQQMSQENIKRKAKGRKLLKQSLRASIGVHGGANLCHVLAACRPVIVHKPVVVRPYEHRTDPRAADAADTEPDWQDDAIKVWKIPVQRARSSSPPKRRHESVEAEASYKMPSIVSDPDVAALIIERVMFNGNLTNSTGLLPRQLRNLKPTDAAVTMEQGVLKVYKGPYATAGAELPNPDQTAWVFAEPDDSPNDRNTAAVAAAAGGDDVLTINHYPLPRTCYSETAMSYIITCHDRRGKFNAAIAKELGVKGQDCKVLIEGGSVPGKDGTTVTPDMVLGGPQRGNGIVVADIPSQDFVDAFMERPEWASVELMDRIQVMYWILGPGMTQDARVHAFIQRHPRLKHVFCAPDTCPNMITHPGPAELQVKMRQIDPQRFPQPKYDNTVKYPAPPADSPVELGRAGKKLKLMPRFIYDEAVAPFVDLAGPVGAMNDDFLRRAEMARAKASDPKLLAKIEQSERDIPNRDAEIISLGTGSSVPSKYRNVSATLIMVPGIGNYLLDCGEGTLGQMRRMLGIDETADVLRNMRCIVISHLHADHHMGTVSLLKAWYEQTLRDGRSDATLAISCIGRFRTMLEELAQVEDVGFHRLRFPSCPWHMENDRDVTTREDLGDDNFGLASITRVRVSHCWRSYGTQLELTSGLRIAYSGDCRPSAAFAEACRGAHLLVHECTFADDKADHARAKKHCTMTEALGVARDMAARRTLLTHFSQRYVKAESLSHRPPSADDDNDDDEQHRVLLALDMMRVRLGDFRLAACYVPAVQMLVEKLNG